MTLTIELTPQEQRRVLGARARGVDIQSLIRGMIAGLPEMEVLADTEGTTENAVLPSVQLWDGGTRPPRPTGAELEAFLAEFAAVGRGKGSLPPEAFDRETLYEDRL